MVSLAQLKHLLVAVVTLALVSGCAGTPSTGQNEPSWLERNARLLGMTSWTARGKIALRTPDESESGSLLWQQLGELTHIRVSGPLGLSATTVDSDGQTLEIRQGDDYSRWPIEQYEQQYPGWNLPITALPHWLKGVSDPNLAVEALQLDQTGQLPLLIKQHGWTVTYERFDGFDGQQLPTRLRLAKGETTARIILRDWQTDPQQ